MHLLLNELLAWTAKNDLLLENNHAFNFKKMDGVGVFFFLFCYVFFNVTVVLLKQTIMRSLLEVSLSEQSRIVHTFREVYKCDDFGFSIEYSLNRC